ncbi:MAG: hypothetical protein GXP45_03290 [bacterium]|nr:hypothetical protein [bacterium]
MGNIRGMKITRDAEAEQKLSVDQSKKTALSHDISKEEFNKYLDAILPNQNTISGPLLFMGISLFKFQNFSSMEAIKGGNWEKLFFTSGIQILVIVIYSLAMFSLFIINLIRVGFLWVAIIFAPFLVLVSVLKSIGGLKLDFLDEKLKRFNV